MTAPVFFYNFSRYGLFICVVFAKLHGVLKYIGRDCRHSRSSAEGATTPETLRQMDRLLIKTPKSCR